MFMIKNKVPVSNKSKCIYNIFTYHRNQGIEKEMIPRLKTEIKFCYKDPHLML